VGCLGALAFTMRPASGPGAVEPPQLSPLRRLPRVRRLCH